MVDRTKSAIEALVSSHEHLSDLVRSLGPEQISGPSYCSEWNVAQVLSHLGSGAEISLLMLNAALSGAEAPSRELYQPIWDRWNGRSDEEKAAEVLVADGAYVGSLVGVEEEALSKIDFDAFGRRVDAAGLIGMRLGEHVIHTWDIEVMGRQDAELLPRATEILVDRVPLVGTRLARGSRPAAPISIEVATEGVERQFVIDLTGDEPAITAGTSAHEGDLAMAAAALVRLVYGRLDPLHTPGATTISGPVSLDDLRALYSGF